MKNFETEQPVYDTKEIDEAKAIDSERQLYQAMQFSHAQEDALDIISLNKIDQPNDKKLFKPKVKISHKQTKSDTFLSSGGGHNGSS